MVAFRDDGHLSGMCAEESFLCVLLSGEGIAVDDAAVVALQLSFEDDAQRCSDQRVDIGGVVDFGTSDGDGAGQVDFSCQEQPSEEEYGCRVDCPYHFALVDGVDVVHLYAYITGRAGSVENVHVGILRLQQCIVVLLYTQSDIYFGNLRQRRDACLPSGFVAGNFEFELTRQRHVA